MRYFYSHLFAAEPEISAMFPAAMNTQRHRLYGALQAIAADGDEAQTFRQPGTHTPSVTW